MRGILVGLFAVVVLGLAGLAFFRCEGEPPVVELEGPLAVGREARPLEVGLVDEGSGLRDVRVEVVSPSDAQTVLEQAFPGGWLLGAASGAGREAVEVTIDPRALKLPDGESTLRVTARDWSWLGLVDRGRTVAEIPLLVDTKPPRIAVENGLTYLQTGGSGLAVYQLGEAAARDGVLVGEAFFRGFPYPGGSEGRRLAFFAIPHDAPADVPIRVVAEDAAGNRAAASWATRLKHRRFPDVQLNLPPRFMENKVVELAEARGIDPADRVAAFQRINREGRAEDEARVREITSETVPEKLWQGAFEQLRNSKVTSEFAEQRSYFVEGDKISEATHYGYDLAVTTAAPITAANSGRVIWADDLGIYGGTVILDHGFDLFTLYGHLSRIDVAVGDRVDKGAVLGLSGATGLAGGDHLHYATLLGDVYVDPVEWWDPKWIKDKLEPLLADLPEPAPLAGAEAPAEGVAPVGSAPTAP